MTFLVCFAASLTVKPVWLLMTWRQERARSHMLRQIARIKHQHRSRTPGGSGQTDSRALPQVALSFQAGVERSRTTAPPAPENLVGVAAFPPQAAPTRVFVSGGRGVTRSPTSPALAGLDTLMMQLHQAGE
jgi:hypothetical protein